MKTISVLDKNTIDKIAAGEVIERPSSIVKELVENAIDAGSNAVTVEIKDGGTTLVRITDNGEGIAPSEVKKAFMRHQQDHEGGGSFRHHFPGIPWRGSFQYCGGLPGGAYYQDGRRADRRSLCY